MGKYLAELYLARRDGAELDGVADRAQRAAEEMSAEGAPVAFLHSIYVPDDETWFGLFEAGSLDIVDTATRRADLACERIVAAEHVQRFDA